MSPQSGLQQSGTAFDAQYAAQDQQAAIMASAISSERFSAEYAEYVTLQEQVLVASSGTAADAEYVVQSLGGE